MRKHILFLTLSLLGCGGELTVTETADTEAAISIGPAPVRLTVLRDPLLSSAILDNGAAQVFTTGSTYRAFTGHDLPGVNWAAYEWVVLYAPGRSYQWSRPALEIRTADHIHHTLVRKLNSPGKGCNTPYFPEAHGPYALVKFTSSSSARIGYLNWRSDVTYEACQGPIVLGCAYGACPSSQVCRLSNGAATCVSPPASCDNVLCGNGKVCGYVSDSAACFPVWGASGFGMIQPPFQIPDGSPPVCITNYDSNCDDLTVSFPPAPPVNLSCNLLHCNSNEYCDWTSGTCKSKYSSGGQN